MQQFSDLTDVEGALEHFHPSRLKRFAYTTEHVQEFMRYLGNPQDVPRAFHIAGTSGKTSTAYYTAALLQQAGKKAGLLVSPHIEKITERVQINLQPLPDREFCDEMAIFLDLVKKSSITLTYAEIMYAFAYWEFVRQGVEYIVAETGMGGLLDATNVINRHDKVCIITDIGLDHMNVLGDTLTEIAKHKVGIIRQQNTVFCHLQSDEIVDVIRQACQQYRADLHILSATEASDDLPLFQQRNFSLAAAAVDFALERRGVKLTPAQRLAAAHVVIPGRMEVFRVGGKTVILDAAHNPQKLQALHRSLSVQFPGEKMGVLCAFVQTSGRNLTDLANEIVPLASHVIATRLPSSGHQRTSRSPQDITEAFQQSGFTDTSAIDDPAEAYRALMQRPEPTLLVTGSLYLLEAIRPLVRKFH